MKVALIAIAALCIFDAAVWHGAYRMAIVRQAVTASHFITEQNWAWLK